MLRSPPSTRHSQVAAYVAFTGAGLAAALFPSPSVQESSGRILALVWVVFLIAGGAFSAVGRMMGRWIGEYVGIPLLAGAFAVYVIALAWSTIATGRLTGITAAAALAAILFLVAARWFEVNQIRVEAIRGGKRARGEILDARHRADGGH